MAGALAVSPICDLEPIRGTRILNDVLQIDPAEARSQSPICNPPVPSSSALIAVGSLETEEFHRQADTYVRTFSGEGRRLTKIVPEGVDHLDIIPEIARQDGELFRHARGLLKTTSPDAGAIS